MSMDFELFPGKNLSGLFQDIYNNQINKKERISQLIADLKSKIKHNGDVALIGPIIKDLIDTSVKNDDHLVKLATIAQRIMLANNKSNGDAGFLSDEEKAQLLKDLEDAKEEVEKMDDLVLEIDELKKKVK
jgi:argininosuccinate lyase